MLIKIGIIFVNKLSFILVNSVITFRGANHAEIINMSSSGGDSEHGALLEKSLDIPDVSVKEVCKLNVFDVATNTIHKCFASNIQ